MAGWGGARAGSGPKTGGAAQIRRDVDRAFRLGFAHAAISKYKHLATGDVREDAVLAVSMVVSDAIQAGEGLKALAVWASIMPKNEEGSGDAKETLDAAIARLNGMSAVSEVSRSVNTLSDSVEKSISCIASAADNGSVALDSGPFFRSQLPLLVGAGEADGGGGRPPAPLRPPPP